MSAYYILVGRETKHEKFEMLFGDYKRAVVVQESRDTTDYVQKRVLKIGEWSMDAMVTLQELNAAEPPKPRKV